MGAQNIANGSASLEPDFSANTINTTWYSDGQQVNGPTTCTYDSDLNLPAALSKPGYVFGGWRLKPRCLIPSSLVSNGGNAFAAKRLDGGSDSTYGGATAETYGISNPGEWGVTWSNGDKVTGVAKCSALPGNDHGYQWGGDSSDWTADETTLTNATGETRYCWCKATHYTANNAQQCSLSSPAWVSLDDFGSAADCADGCASDCGYSVQFNSFFRVAMFTGLVAE